MHTNVNCVLWPIVNNRTGFKKNLCYTLRVTLEVFYVSYFHHYTR
ncbi:hypothetical protein QWZ13_18210 [Reinekea marina]|nr:hypothetical protein [Reinekea marina]MDN3650845.1 hypothetical protein [Reinekea marina]